MQTWPLLTNDAKKIFFATAFGSTSSMTIAGSLPPSSSVTRFSVAAALASTFLPVATEPVNEILSIPAMLRHPGAELVAAREHVDDAGREHVLHDLADLQRRERRVRRRLQDHRVARVERRHERAERQIHGRVPRRDDADDAERPVAQLDVLVVVVGEHLDGNLDADHAVGLRGAAIDLGDRLRERLALLARQELGELVLPLAQLLRQLLHERGAIRERARAPGGKRARARQRRRGRARRGRAAGQRANTVPSAGLMTSRCCALCSSLPSISSEKSVRNVHALCALC